MSLSGKWHWIYVALITVLTIILLIVVIFSRRELVEARVLLSQTLLDAHIANIFIITNNTEDARKRINQVQLSIIQYALLRNIGHSTIAGNVHIVHEAGVLQELQGDTSQNIYDYTDREPLWWELLDNYFYTQWKNSGVDWADLTVEPGDGLELE